MLQQGHGSGKLGPDRAKLAAAQQNCNSGQLVTYHLWSGR